LQVRAILFFMAVSGKGARAKGANAERELIDIFNKEGIPSMRVIGSGAHFGAKADLKIGVALEDGKLPHRDEGVPRMYAEVKNRMSNPEWFHDAINNKLTDVATVRLMDRLVPEQIIKDQEQDDRSSILILRRKRVPSGALKKNKYNESHTVCMGLGKFIELFKKAYPNFVVEGFFDSLTDATDEE